MYDLDNFDFSTALGKVFKNPLNEVFFKNSFEEKLSLEQVEGFEDKGVKYEFKHDFGKNAQKSDIQVSLENESEIEVSYYHKDKKSASSFQFTETLPVDAIPETLEATINDGILTISVDKRKENENPDRNKKRNILIN